MLKTLKKYFLNDKDKWVVLEKKLFDRKFYQQTNLDLVTTKSCFDHYHNVGWKEGRDPNEWFSVNKYLSDNIDVSESGMDPFYHYIRFGIREGRKIYPSNKKDCKNVPNSKASLYGFIDKKTDELVSEITRGFVDESFYTRNYKDLEFCTSSTFHYFMYGWKDGRDPSMSFSTELFFLENKLDRSDITPLLELVNGNTNYKIFPSRVACQKLEESQCFNEIELCKAFIDKAFYAATYGINDKQTEHYCTVGYIRNYNPNTWFNTGEYKKRNPLLVNSCINPLYYYLKEGYKKSNLNSNKISGYKGLFDLYKAVPLSVSPIISNYVQYIDSLEFLEKRIDSKKVYDINHLYLHWLIPDFTKGGGGHLNIFRIIRFLELHGFVCKIWIVNPSHRDKISAYCDIIKFYPTVKADVELLSFDNYPTDGDAIVATSWETVEWMQKVKNYQIPFYFVQDYEKLFFPKGSNYFLAENTYYENINCICASPWLEKILKKEYGRNTCSYLLGYNKNDFYVDESVKKFSELDGKKHIVVYSRIHTARRAVELSLIALHQVAKKRSDFVVHCIGGGIDLLVAPFDYVLYDVLNMEQLRNLYNACDFGICFSATNYSLLPQEMMASGLPLLELDGDNTRTIFPKDVIKLVKPVPESIRDSIEYMLDHADECRIIAENAKRWVSNIPWEKSYTTVKDFITQTVNNEFAKSEIISADGQQTVNVVIATVVIPVYNPDASFKRVLEKICSQITTWDYEVLIIDSSTEENSWCRDYRTLSDKIVYHRIEPKDFQHGRTRNLGVKLSRGEYVAFITQDALPYDDFWLYNLVTVLSKYDDVAIAFGKHYPYENSSSFVKRDIVECFNNLLKYPLVLNKKTDFISYVQENVPWMQMLHFYSDNNSCLKKKYWKKIPMRDVDFGEDQLLAFDMINAGYGKIYVPSAGVFHSHNYNALQTYERAKIEKDFFEKYFGYDLIQEYSSYDEFVNTLNKIDKEYAEKSNITDDELEEKYKLNEAKAKAYFDLPMDQFS